MPQFLRFIHVFTLLLIFSLSASVVFSQSTIISDISVEGTSQLEANQILFSIESQVNNSLEWKKIRRDVHSIYKMGLFQKVQVQLEQDDTGYQITFVVTERPRIQDILFEGMTIITRTDLDKKLTLKALDTYDASKVEANRKIIYDEYRKQGYARVKVLAKIEPVDRSGLPSSEKEAHWFLLKFIVEEFPKVFLSDIYISGTEFFSELQLKRYISSSEIDCFAWFNSSGVFQEEQVNQDLAIISQYYLQNGYIKLFIEKPDARLIHNPEYSRLEIRLNITEGAQYFAGKIDVSGDLLGDKQALIDELRLKEGDVYNPFLQNQDRSVISELYQEQGYAFVRVIPQVQVHDDNHTVDVNYQIIKGEKAYIGRISTVGNAETRDYVIRREFEVVENELYNGKKLRLSQENMNRLGFFEKGTVMERNARERESDLLDLTVRLKEAQTGTFQAQIGYSDQSRFTGGMSLSKGNLFGRGQTLRLSAQFSERNVQNDFSVTFIDPRIMDSRLSGSLSASYRRKEDTTGLGRGTILENSYGFSLGIPVYYRELRFINSFNAIDRLYQDATPNVFKRSVTQALVYNSVNHPVFPSHGLRSSLSVIHTGTPFGGNVRSREYLYNYQQFWALNQTNTLIAMARARFGLLQKQGTEIPAEDRYRIGGMSTIRGHRTSQIAGPYGGFERSRNRASRVVIDENGFQRIESYDVRTDGMTFDELQRLKGGGISKRIFNAELLFPLSQDKRSFVRGVVFFDAGNVNAESEQYRLLGENEPRFMDLRTSMGGGFRLITPMGVLRFEYGVKLDKRKGETPDRFDFSISGLF